MPQRLAPGMGVGSPHDKGIASQRAPKAVWPIEVLIHTGRRLILGQSTGFPKDWSVAGLFTQSVSDDPTSASTTGKGVINETPIDSCCRILSCRYAHCRRSPVGPKSCGCGSRSEEQQS